MNPELPPNPRAELEARLTAFLLDELPAHEAAALRQALDDDTELAKLCERLKPTIKLVRETAHSEPQNNAAPETLKLSEERRQKLLAHFKTITPQEFVQPRARKKFRIVELAAAAAIILLLGIVLLPTLSRSKNKAINREEFVALSAPEIETLRQQHGVVHFKPQNQNANPGSAPSAEDAPPAPTEPALVPAPVELAATPAPVDAATGQTVVVLPPNPQLAYDSQLGLGASKGDGSTLNANGNLAGTAMANSGASYYLQNGQVTPAGSTMQNGDKVTTLGDVPSLGHLFRPAGSSQLTDSMSLVERAQSAQNLLKDQRATLAQSSVDASNVQFGGGGGGGANVQQFAFTAGNQRNRDLDRNGANATVAGTGELNQPNATVPLAIDNSGSVGGNGIVAQKMIQSSPPPSVQLSLDAGADPKLKSASIAPTGGRLPATDTELAAKKIDLAKLESRTDSFNANLTRSLKESQSEPDDFAPHLPATPTPAPPEVLTSENAYSTFSLNISDVSFKLAAASLEKGVLPEPASVRSEEFINAFDYRDPLPAPGAPIGFASERARYPFAQNRDLLRFSVRTAAAGREAGRPLNLVLLLDNSGSMMRADRVRIIHEALRVLATQLQPQDKLSIVVFARTARLLVDGVSGIEAGAALAKAQDLTPQGGTNLEDAMKLAYETARQHYLANGINRVVLLTDGAANLGNVDSASLKQQVAQQHRQGIALDCFGIGWEGYNDDLLEVLSRTGDGRYGFLNTPAEAATDFAGQLAGALRVAAENVKVQVEFNPKRVTSYRQIGYARHQLAKEQFRDNNVAAAQIGAAESGNALYVVAVNPAGEGPLGTVHVRYQVPGTADYEEHDWQLPYTGNSVPLEQGSPALRLAATAGAFSEWLSASPYAAEVTPDELLNYLRGVPQVYGADARPAKLEWMIRQAKSISGK